MSVILVILVILILLFIVGVIMLVVGRRGVAIDDHPLCARCGFDLFGRPDGVDVCSECGGDLRQPHAIRLGHRRPRAGLAWTGGSLAAVGILGFGFFGWLALGSTNWQQLKPVWWLRWDTRSSDPKTRDPALTELDTRLNGGKLTDDQIAAVCDAALAVQADASQPWSPLWGNLVEDARLAQKLSDERWKQYALNAPNFALDVRPSVRIGDRIYYWIRNNPARVGSRSRLYAWTGLPQWDIGPLNIAKDRSVGTGGNSLSANGSGASGTGIEAKAYEGKLAPGDWPVRYTVDLELRESSSQPGPNIATKQLILQGTVKLLPASQPSVTVIRDDSLKPAIAKALKVSHASYSEWNSGYLNVTVNVDGPPVGIGFDVFAVADGKEHRIGRFAAPGGKRNHGWGMGERVPSFDADTVDLIFRSSPKAATETTDTFEVWDGEVVLRGVKVQPPPGATQPATAPATVPTRPAARPTTTPARRSTAPG
jgi:hypothetical protein